MNYRNNPELQDRLAAEYVLGTLRGRARLRFQAWLREDAALRRVVESWEARLAPMAEGVADVRPPHRVWRAIEARIARPARTVPAAAQARGGLWESVAFWRGWGLVATGCAAALVGALALQKPETVTVPVVKTVEVPAPPDVIQASYVAILNDAAGKPAFIAYAARKSSELWVKRIGVGAPADGKGFELWGLPAKPGEAAVSLGMMPADEKGTMKLAALADVTLSDFPALAVTLEPAAGSGGKATGPLLAKGDCFRFW